MLADQTQMTGVTVLCYCLQVVKASRDPNGQISSYVPHLVRQPFFIDDRLVLANFYATCRA